MWEGGYVADVVRVSMGCIVQKSIFQPILRHPGFFPLFSHEGKNKDRFFKNTSHYYRGQTATVLNTATHNLITKFFLEKFKKKMVDRHGGLKSAGLSLLV